MKFATVAEVKAQLSAYLKESEHGPVIVTRNGKPVAALLAVHDDEEIERLIISHSPRLQALLDSASRQVRAGEGVGHADFWHDVADESPARGAE